MTKKSYKGTCELEHFRVEKQSVNGKWVPIRLYGGILERTQLESLMSFVKVYQKEVNYRTKKPYIPQKIRYVRILTQIQSHTTVTKSLVEL